MKFTVKSEKPASVKSSCVVLGVFERRKLSDSAARFDKTTRGLLARLLHDGDMDGSCGQTLMVHYPSSAACERVLLVGCGKPREFNDSNYAKAVTSAAQALDISGAGDAVSYLAELDVPGRDTYWKVRTLIEGSQGAVFTTDELKSKKTRVGRPL